MGRTGAEIPAGGNVGRAELADYVERLWHEVSKWAEVSEFFRRRDSMLLRAVAWRNVSPDRPSETLELDLPDELLSACRAAAARKLSYYTRRLAEGQELLKNMNSKEGDGDDN